MDKQLDFWRTIGEIREKDNRFAEDAYIFVMEALEYTVSSLDERRHVSGRELLDGITGYARKQYGMLAYSVLESWGIRATADFGAIVFHLVEAGILARRECDSIEDFEDVFDLESELAKGYFD
jgi:uncharacterized repeat protein (TIGR04138 family)